MFLKIYQIELCYLALNTHLIFGIASTTKQEFLIASITMNKNIKARYIMMSR